MELNVANLAVSLGTRRVLEGVGARFRAGRVTAVLGPNGSGKTTLVRALAGLVDAEAGQVRLDDRAVGDIEPRERARLIGYLPQDGAVHWNVGVRELVGLGRLPYRARFTGASLEDVAAVEAALMATDTRDLANRGVGELSGGERARVLLARVLGGSPRWLLADEPLASLDPLHQLEMLARLREQAAAGVGVVIVLHDLIQAARAADDVVLLKQGRVVAAGPAGEVLTPGPLREAFGVEVAMVPVDATMLPIPLGRAER